MKIRRRSRSLAIAAALGLAAILLVVLALRSAVRPEVLQNPMRTVPSGLRLPFETPCAVNSGDAAVIFSALRARDRTELMKLVSEKRLVMVRKGVPVTITRAGSVNLVQVIGTGPGIRSCYIGPELLAAIARNGN